MKSGARRLVLLAVAAAALPACTPANSRRTPDGHGVHSLHQRALAICACLRAGRDLPRRRFTTDVCSASPDCNYGACCIDHDISYWCGGSAEDRAEADARLARCVMDQGHSRRYGELVRLTVGLGGGPWSPFPWRWAYGWKTLRGYDERPGGREAAPCFKAGRPGAEAR